MQANILQVEVMQFDESEAGHSSLSPPQSLYLSSFLWNTSRGIEPKTQLTVWSFWTQVYRKEG